MGLKPDYLQAAIDEGQVIEIGWWCSAHGFIPKESTLSDSIFPCDKPVYQEVIDNGL